MYRNNKKNFLKTLIIGVLLISVGIGFFFFWSKKKQVWFCDEIYTYQSVNGFEQGMRWPGESKAVWLSGDEITKFFSADTDQYDLEAIAMNLYGDHVPFYFWIFRIISVTFFRGKASIWIGLSINLFFYLNILALLYYFFSKSLQNSLYGFLIVLITCVLSRMGMEQALMIRMYEMLLFAELCFLGISMRILRRVECGEKTYIELAAIFLCIVFGFLTHFHFWVFFAASVSVLCLMILFLLWKKKEKRTIGMILKSAEVRTVVACFLIFLSALFVVDRVFPYWKWNLQRGKGELAIKSVGVFSKVKFEQIRWGYQDLVISIFGYKMPMIFGLLIIGGLIGAGAYILWRRGEKEKFHEMLFVIIAIQLVSDYSLLYAADRSGGQISLGK